MRDPNAKTLVNKALADEMRASARGKSPPRTSSSSTPAVHPSSEPETSPPSTPLP